MTMYGCRFVINHMAFYPDRTDVLPADRLPDPVREVFIRSEDDIRLQCYFIPDASSDAVLVYFHGNSGNIGHRLPDLMRINRFGINVLGVSYRGYGKSQGRPSEQGLYKDGRAAMDYVRRTLGFAPDRIFIMGRSIGSTVAMDVSRDLQLAGIILVTPLTTGRQMAKAVGLGFFSFIAGDAFDNLEKAGGIAAPVLVIHGTQDEIVPFAMGKRLYERIKTRKAFVPIDGAGHNDLSTRFEDSYWPPIGRFIDDPSGVAGQGSTN